MTSQVTRPRGNHIQDEGQHRAWWKEASVYQIYPASFCDSTGNGTGDICGIISKLDHVEALGVDVVWLCPIFASPQIDMGYDISDYKTIDPQYGSIEDVDLLMHDLHGRGIKLLLDLVVNHTSDQHEWFKQSRSGTIHIEIGISGGNPGMMKMERDSLQIIGSLISKVGSLQLHTFLYFISFSFTPIDKLQVAHGSTTLHRTSTTSTCLPKSSQI